MATRRRAITAAAVLPAELVRGKRAGGAGDDDGGVRSFEWRGVT